jgi:hypothetical protein
MARGIKAIVRVLGLAKETVRRFYRATGVGERLASLVGVRATVAR